MDVVGSAVGITSLGIQVCQGLLSYYDGWKAYKTDTSAAHECIADLSKTFTLLQELLSRAGLDPARAERAARCLDLCVGGLERLQKKLQKLQTHTIPSGFRQKAWDELQRSFYPFRESTLVKLRETVNELQSRLSLALQVLQLDLGAESSDTLTKIEVHTKEIAVHLATQNERLLEDQRTNQFKKIVDWLSPPNPWKDYASARRHHESQTGSWFLRSNQYQRWRSGLSRHIWLYGKAGCGKTVLSSTVIADLRLHCESAVNIALAVFYFSFSDSQKQLFESLLSSLVAQLGWKGPGQLILQREYDKPNRCLPGPEVLEEVLLSSIRQYDSVFLTLDALDESPESDGGRRDLLDFLGRLSQKAANLRILATSRDLGDIRKCMDSLEAQVVPISTSAVNADIGTYVSSHLSRDRKLSCLDEGTKTLIRDTFARKGDGMFRWAYCQLQELKNLKSTKPKYVKATLLSLPATLDATYERMLTGIEEIFRKEALVLLRWLVYARSPPSLRELAEATIIDPAGMGDVDVDNRGDIADVLEILSGLVTLEGAEDDGEDNDDNKNMDLESRVYTSEDSSTGSIVSIEQIDRHGKLRLAHFSVKEYLESKRILQSGAKDFYLDSIKEHRFLAQSCLTYLIHYSGSSEKISNTDDLVKFPLLEYAAESWYYHSSFQESSEIGREVLLLSSAAVKLDWIRIHQPDKVNSSAFRPLRNVGSALYYASYIGLEKVVNALITAGLDVNAPGGDYSNALYAASIRGHEKTVEILIDRGADINAPGGHYGNALQAASIRGHEKTVEILIDRGADVNAPGGHYGNALYAASRDGYKKIVEILIDRGADVNAPGGHYGNVLQAASRYGYKKIVEILIDRGVDINAPGGYYGNALQAASRDGHKKIVEILIDRGADINA